MSKSLYRETWDSYFMRLAKQVATRGTCDRALVGCVLTRDKRIIATGYNGSPPGHPHCDDQGHVMIDGHCVRTIHAEMNAILQAARTGTSLDGTTCYTTHEPCLNCMKSLLTAGIKRVVFLKMKKEDHDTSQAKMHLMAMERPQDFTITRLFGFGNVERSK